MVTGHIYPSGMAIKITPLNMMCKPSFVPSLRVRPFVACPKIKSICAAYQEREILTLRGGAEANFSGAPMPVLRDGGKHVHMINGRKRRPCAAAAAAAKKKEFIYPQMTSKPRWWWRTLACLPYLVPLHEAWSIAGYVYRLHPYMEKFDFLTDPFLITYSMVPRWLLMFAYFMVYYFVGRRKELPHFARFHIFLALLLSQAIGAMGMVCGWMPGVVFKGRMAYLWAAFAFAEMLTVLHCMQCSLRGMYSDIPFISDSTYINLSWS